MITKNDLVELISSELKRQYDDKDGVGWYTVARSPTGEIAYVAIDGNPNLYKLAQIILENIKGFKK